MKDWNREKENYIEKLISSDMEKSAEWFQEKARELSTLMVYYKSAIREVETKFNVLNDVFSSQYDRNPISSIKSRLKTPQSIINKIRTKELPLTLEAIEQNLNDVAGVRIICAFVQDVYDLVDMFLKQDDIKLIQIKDYIKNPKPNGYRSLHLIIEIPIFLTDCKKNMRVEIQFRTIAMDFWASLEHQLRYKKNFSFTEEMANDLTECAELSAKLDFKMDTLRETLQQ